VLPGCRPGPRAVRRAAIAGVFGALIAGPAGAAPARHAAVLEIDGIIGPAVADYVVREVARVAPGDTGIVVLRIDTPGGLDRPMREIIRAILASPVPVAAYVAPSGARAASAGTYIAYASAIAAMAPGTNLGAATPIQLGGPPAAPGGQPDRPGGDGNDDAARGTSTAEPADTETRKMVNDAAAYIRSLAELNGRNADWAVEAVRRSVSLPASEALRLHVIDVIADDVPDLLRKIDGRTVTVAGKRENLATAGLELVTVAPDWRVRALAIITDPTIAYILMLIGIGGLAFELMNPGTVLPGVVGAISLLVALFALSLLPVDFAGAGLVLLGIALMIAEAFIGAFGVIGLAGVAAFAIGSIFLFHSEGPGFGLPLSVVAAATAVAAGFFVLVLAMLLRSRRMPVVTGSEGLMGAEGEVLTWQDGDGRVLVQGESWLARAPATLQPAALRPGARVRVVGREGLVLMVEAA
jgi:membrane-bound serine protease (ClpP class)